MEEFFCCCSWQGLHIVWFISGIATAKSRNSHISASTKNWRLERDTFGSKARAMGQLFRHKPQPKACKWHLMVGQWDHSKESSRLVAFPSGYCSQHISAVRLARRSKQLLQQFCEPASSPEPDNRPWRASGTSRKRS